MINEDGCWLLIGREYQQYPSIHFCGINFQAKTLSAIAFLGLKLNQNFNIPQGIMICHKRPCKNKACFNPEHIYIGNAWTNAKDEQGIDGSELAKDIIGKEPNYNWEDFIQNK